jgi:hypothetical protein
MLRDLKQFLLGLEDSTKKKLYLTRRHTFVTGLCVTINGVIQLVQQLIVGPGLNTIHLKYLLTFKLSQDNIEVMFGTIRRRGGWKSPAKTPRGWWLPRVRTPPIHLGSK